MPMPHRTFAQVAKRRLVGKEGRERIREVRALLAELPDYRNGPYADLRKSLLAEIEDTRVRSSAVHRDSIAVRREGAAQIALVGPPNVGKSSILQAISDIQIKTGDYAFTTLRPVPALTRIGGVLVQFVEIPGLIGGATDDRGGGRALLGVLRAADAIVYCGRAGRRSGRAPDRPRRGRPGRHRQAGDPGGDPRRRGAPAIPVIGSAAFPDRACRVSVLDEASLDALREAVWALTGLIRVWLRRDGGRTRSRWPWSPERPSPASPTVHHDLGQACTGAGSGDLAASRASASVATMSRSTATRSRSSSETRPTPGSEEGGAPRFDGTAEEPLRADKCARLSLVDATGADGVR